LIFNFLLKIQNKNIKRKQTKGLRISDIYLSIVQNCIKVFSHMPTI